MGDLDSERCTCGWGGVHDPDNPRCERNAALTDRLAGLRDVVAALDDSLTHKGTAQWLTARNRYLDGRRPVEVLAQGRVEDVIEAANAYAEGVYL